MIGEAATALGLLVDIREVFDYVRTRLAREGKTQSGVYYRRMRAILNELHFSEGGIIDVVRKVSEGKPLDATDRGKIVEFKDGQKLVLGFLDELEKTKIDPELVPIRQRQNFEMIRYGKLDVRNVTYRFLLDNDGDPTERVEAASALLCEIEKLNSSIEALEELIFGWR